MAGAGVCGSTDEGEFERLADESVDSARAGYGAGMSSKHKFKPAARADIRERSGVEVPRARRGRLSFAVWSWLGPVC